MKKRIVFTGIISLVATLSVVAQKNVIDEIIWVVGEEVILRSDVEKYRRFMQEEGIRFEGDPYCFIPEMLAQKKLFLSQAKIDSIEADESFVIRYVDQWVNYMIQNFGSQEKLEEYMGGKKLTQIKEDQKIRFREDQIEGEMKKKIVGDIRLRPSEVTQYYNRISKDSLPMIPTTVEAAIIVMEPVIPVEDVDAIKARLRAFTEQINKGEETFEYLAMRYSDDLVTRMLGGRTGLMSKMHMAPEYAAAAFALKDPSRISPVVQTEYGYHIIQLIEERGDRIDTRHILLRPKVSDQEIGKAMASLDTLYTAILDGKLTFEEATVFSSDKDTRNNNGNMVNQNEESRNSGTFKFEMEELPQGMGVVIEKMEIGEISKPFRMKNAAQNDVVVIVKLNARVNVHQANLQDDYQELKAVVENQKREEILREWIISKQKTTYVRISDGWCECDFKFPGWIKE